MKYRHPDGRGAGRRGNQGPASPHIPGRAVSLWLGLGILAAWLGVCVMVVALCAMAARGDAQRVPGEPEDPHGEGRGRRPAGLRVTRRRERRADEARTRDNGVDASA
jgi:hypothetical protein